jgi:hypothetical protein
MQDGEMGKGNTPQKEPLFDREIATLEKQISILQTAAGDLSDKLERFMTPAPPSNTKSEDEENIPSGLAAIRTFSYRVGDVTTVINHIMECLEI